MHFVCKKRYSSYLCLGAPLVFALFIFFGCVVAVYMNSFVRSHMKQWWNIYIIDYGM